MIRTVLFFFLGIAASDALAQTDSVNTRITFLKQQLSVRKATSEESRELKQYGYQVQNHAFVLDEHDHDYTGALKLADSAMQFWLLLNDTVHRANLLKYRGYLLGNLGRFADAKQDIATAISLFANKKQQDGVAVSKFDLSHVYERELKPDSAMIYCDQSLVYWTARRDTFRMLTINNQRINLAIKMENYRLADDIQKITLPFLTKGDLHPLPVMDFYFLSIQLFKKMDNSAQEKHYTEIFNEKEKQLKTENRMPVLGYSAYP
jgi:tetratricopeptide (TPR) repeat protein